MKTDDLIQLYRIFLGAYGPQGWWPADDCWEIVVGAILTQRVAWRNAAAAIEGLRQAGLLEPASIDRTSSASLATAIRPALFYNAKAAKLKAFARFLFAEWGGDLGRLLAQPTERLRKDLLTIHGIGPETADAIVLYAAGRPTFVADRYALRLFERLGWIPAGAGYEATRSEAMAAWAADAATWGEFHALVVRHGREHCMSQPGCSGCPVRRRCGYAETREVER